MNAMAREDGATMARCAWAAFLLALRRMAYSKLMLASLALAALPVLIVLLVLLHGRGMPDIHSFYELLLRNLYLRFIIFFIANVLGFALLRQESEDQTLHYLFLQPVRRWVLVAGKFAAYLVLASALCIASLWLTYLLMALPALGLDGVVGVFFGKGRFVILCQESLVLVLGLLIYGAVAMMMGGIFKSGIYALLLLGWENALPYLPSLLKYWTAAHYLQSLLPERPTTQTRIFELLGELSPVWLSCTALLGTSLLVLAIATLIFQLKECRYGDA